MPGTGEIWSTTTTKDISISVSNLTPHGFQVLPIHRNQTKTSNHNANKETLSLTTLMSPLVLIIYSTSGKTQYVHILYHIDRKGTSKKIESDAYTKKNRTCDLLMPPFYSFFSIFYNNTTQNIMPLHSLHHTVLNNLPFDE